MPRILSDTVSRSPESRTALRQAPEGPEFVRARCFLPLPSGRLTASPGAGTGLSSRDERKAHGCPRRRSGRAHLVRELGSRRSWSMCGKRARRVDAGLQEATEAADGAIARVVMFDCAAVLGLVRAF